MRSLNEIINILEWAKTNGAVHIKVGEAVEVVFPPPVLAPPVATAPDAGNVRTKPIDDPDYMIDEWAGHRPMPRVG